MDKNLILHDLRKVAQALNKLCKDLEVGSYDGNTITVSDGGVTKSKEVGNE